MFKKFKNIRPAILISHLVITLGYPAAKAFTAQGDRLMAFADAMTIVALVLLIGGIVYSMALHGDFDISGYYIKYGGRSLSRRFSSRRAPDEKPQKDIAEYLSEVREKRADSFNYPLLLGILYLLAAAVIGYGFLS